MSEGEDKLRRKLVEAWEKLDKEKASDDWDGWKRSRVYRAQENVKRWQAHYDAHRESKAKKEGT